MNQRFTQLGLVSLAIVAGLPASAQTSTTGALVGTVKDAKGLPVPGATVRITSGQISRTVVTGAEGTFRLPLLNPGAMDISITKAGFSTINQKVDVSINETKTLNFKMVTEAEVTVIVAAAMEGIDTTTAQTGSNFSMDTIKSIPVGRTMDSLTLLTPGATDSGMGSAGTAANSVFGASLGGASGAENSYVVDGIGTTDSRYGGNGISLLTDFLDQVEVQTGGFKPEYSALGGVVNVVTKSGSNTFKGSSWFTFDPRGIAAKPKIDRYVVQAERENRYDVGAEVSGPILRDRMFYFVGAGLTSNESPTVRTNSAGASGSSVKRNTINLVGKINWFITPDLQLTLFGNYNPYTFRNDVDVPNYGTANLGYRRDDSTYAYNAMMDWTINPMMILSAKFGVSGNKNDDRPVNPAPHVNDYWYFSSTGPGAGQGLAGFSWETGGSATSTLVSDSKNTQFKADLGVFLGAHQLKFGVSMIRSTFNQDSWIGDRPTGTAYSDYSGGEVEVIRGPNPGSSDVRQREGYLVRRQVAFFNAESRSTYDAIYAQDTWEMFPGFKAAYGVRFENQALKDSNGVEYLKFGFGDSVQPRVGFIWDINNDGQSKITANFAKYHEVFPLRYGLRYRGGRYMYYRKYYYMDPSGDPNSQGAPAQMTYNTQTGAWTHLGPAQYGRLRDSSTGYNDPPVVEGTKPPERSEVILGYERNLPKGWKVNISATHRELKNPIEDMTPIDENGNAIDPGWNGVQQALLGNPRPGIWAWTTKDNSDLGGGVRLTWDSTFPEGFNVYQAVTLGLSHSSENSFLSLNYTWSRLYGTYEGVVSAVNQQVDTNGTASFDYPGLVGRGNLALDRTHVLKAYGSRSFKVGPGSLNLGFNWTYQSGTPLSQLTGNWGGVPPGDWTISPVPIDWAGYGDTPVDFTFGQFGRSPSTNIVDLTVEYTATFGKKISVTPTLNIFNAFNTRYATRLSNSYADGDGNIQPDWGKPTGYQGGRNYRVGLKVRF